MDTEWSTERAYFPIFKLVLKSWYYTELKMFDDPALGAYFEFLKILNTMFKDLYSQAS